MYALYTPLPPKKKKKKKKNWQLRGRGGWEGLFPPVIQHTVADKILQFLLYEP